jgi:hypothetical protein
VKTKTTLSSTGTSKIANTTIDCRPNKVPADLPVLKVDAEYFVWPTNTKEAGNPKTPR